MSKSNSIKYEKEKDTRYKDFKITSSNKLYKRNKMNEKIRQQIKDWDSEGEQEWEQ